MNSPLSLPEPRRRFLERTGAAALGVAAGPWFARPVTAAPKENTPESLVALLISRADSDVQAQIEDFHAERLAAGLYEEDPRLGTLG